MVTRPKLVELMWSDDGKFHIQYDEQTGELYINNKKVLYEVTLTSWQKILAIGVSLALIFQGAMSVITFFFKDFHALIQTF